MPFWRRRSAHCNHRRLIIAPRSENSAITAKSIDVNENPVRGVYQTKAEAEEAERAGGLPSPPRPRRPSSFLTGQAQPGSGVDGLRTRQGPPPGDPEDTMSEGLAKVKNVNFLLPIDGKTSVERTWSAVLGEADYQVVKPLARQGAQSRTFLIRQRETRKLYVAKVIVFESELQFQEIDLLARLQHPHVVRLVTHFTTSDEIVMVMEYCNAGDLASYLRKYRQPSSKWIIRWMSQLCLGLHYVHINNVIHFDLKASNIFLDKNLCVKLGDFGVSCVADQTDSTEIRGTLAYLSPEMLKKKGPKLTWASDCWALGCLLYELMFEGKRAFPLPKIEDSTSAGTFRNRLLYDTFIGRFRRTELLRNIQNLLPGLRMPTSKIREDEPGHIELLRTLLDCLLMHNPHERPSLGQILQLLYTAEFRCLPSGNDNIAVFPAFKHIIERFVPKPSIDGSSQHLRRTRAYTEA